MSKLVIESFINTSFIQATDKVQETATIQGIAASPRISRNGNLYLPEELERADGVTVPLKYEHMPDVIVGKVTYEYDKDMMQLKYRGIVTDESTIKALKDIKHFVSIGADVGRQESICDSKNCFSVPRDLTFEELSLVKTAGIPEATLDLVESYKIKEEPLHKCAGSECRLNKIEQNTANLATLISKVDEKLNMPSNGNAKVTEATITTKVDNVEDINNVPTKSEITCPAGQKDDGNGKCVPVEPAADAPKPEEGCNCEKAGQVVQREVANMKFEDAEKLGVNADWMRTTIEKAIKDKTSEMLEYEKKHNEVHPDSTEAKNAKAELERLGGKQASVSTTKEGNFEEKDMTLLANEMVKALESGSNFKFGIDMSPMWVKENTKVQEAVTWTNSQSNVTSFGGIVALPNGKYAKSIRDLVNFKQIPKGSDTAKFMKGTVPNNQTITEGSAITPAGRTVTTISVTADTVKGDGESIKYADIEDTPAEVMSYLAQTAKIESLEQEATLVFDTTQAAATPNLWIRGDTGATITDDDTASMTFDPKGISVGLQNLEDSQYDVSFGSPYCMMHPKQTRELREDGDLIRWVQQGDASITRTGNLTHLYGCELRSSTALTTVTAQTTNALQAVMGIKGHTFALASKRDLKISIGERTDYADHFWNWSVRKGATAFDVASFIRISTTA